MVAARAGQTNGFLLDTNVVIPMLRQEESALAALDRAEGSLFVSVITLGELRFGARKSGRVEENLQRVEGFSTESEVLLCDEQTAHLYGEVKDGLRRKGLPIPENDIWIAATALQGSLALVTRDVHFENVDGLRIERW